MEVKDENTVIGFSIFEFYEECYHYTENACLIAESYDSAMQYMISCGYNKSEFRIEEISMSMLIKDYGYSSGEYAMEQIAFEKFIKIADKKGLKYSYENFYDDTTLKVVNL